MSEARLKGNSVLPRSAKQARALIGKTVTYLRKSDIDYSGRGYFFPRTGTVESVIRRNIEIDGSWIYLSSLVEMVDAET